MDPVTFQLAGAAVRIIEEGGWRQEQPEAWATIAAAPRQRRGKGYTITVTLSRTVAADLADYLWSVAEVNTEGEGRSSTIEKAARRAVDAIEKELAK